MQARVNQSCSQSCGVKLKACTAFGEHPEAGEMAHLPPRRRFDRPHTLEHSRYDEQRSKYQIEFYDKRPVSVFTVNKELSSPTKGEARGHADRS
jgi:hypothetical protein